MEPLLVITDARAGTLDRRSLDRALRVLRSEVSVEVQETHRADELDSVLHRAGSRRIVVAGADADASLHAVVSCLHRRHDLDRAVLGLIPLGSGADFARVNAIPLDPEEAARVLLTGVVRRRDLLVDEVGEIVADSVHLGAGARTGDPSVHPTGRGAGRRAARLHPPAVHLHVEVDGEVVVDLDDPVLMIAVGNGSMIGAGAELVPGALPGDGLLDVIVWRATGPLGRLRSTVTRAVRRRADRPGGPSVIRLRGSSVTVSGEEFWCSADGEVYGPERHRSWRVEPAAYSLVVPA